MNEVWRARCGIVARRCARGRVRSRRAVIPAQPDGLRKRERLRDLYRQAPPGHDLGHLASTLGPLTGLDHETALRLLTEFAAQT